MIKIPEYKFKCGGYRVSQFNTFCNPKDVATVDKTIKKIIKKSTSQEDKIFNLKI